MFQWFDMNYHITFVSRGGRAQEWQAWQDGHGLAPGSSRKQVAQGSFQLPGSLG